MINYYLRLWWWDLLEFIRPYQGDAWTKERKEKYANWKRKSYKL